MKIPKDKSVEEFLKTCALFGQDNEEIERLLRLVKKYREALNQVVIDSMQDESITRCALKMRSTAANALQYDGLDGGCDEG